MKKSLFLLAMVALCQGAPAQAGPDRFLGDAAIYSAFANHIRPNILLLIDNSNATLNSASGSKYDPAVDYCVSYAACTYQRYSVYAAGQQGDFSTTSLVDNPDGNLGNVTCSNNGNIAAATLRSSGTYVGSASENNPNLKKGTGSAGAGKAVCDFSGKGATYALGNFLNYTMSSVASSGVTQRRVIYDALKTVVGGARYAVNFGAMVYGVNNKGGKVVYQVGNLSNDADFNTFLSLLPGDDGNGTVTGEPVLSSQTARPQAEALLDAGYYFRGSYLPISGQAAMPSPSRYGCDKNHVIVITNGLSNKDDSPQLASTVGDLDGDGAEAVGYGLGSHYLDDVAKYLYETPPSGAAPVSTDTILAFQADDVLVRRAADDSHGRGEYHNVYNANELAAALFDVITKIMLETDTSFVAPVVPVSPENRAFSGSRLYMAFFKPRSEKYWYGNLKKLGVNSVNALTDRNRALACYTDIDGDGSDDVDGARLPSGALSGSFRSSSSSFWNSSSDAGFVEVGGAGEVLVHRDLGTNSRRIYTYTGTSSDLTDASNALSTANSAISAGLLGVADAAAKDRLIRFVHGYDAFDENGNGNTTEKRGASLTAPSGWIVGDILHSRPLVVSYASYPFSASNEADCSINKSMIYVGANDGMFHAIRDCDGGEAWAFVPRDLLGNLKYLSEGEHAYYLDSTPSAYIYDSGNDGNLSPSNGDKVILIFGERRGGGSDAAPTSGSYYALDVSDPAAPRLLWRISNQTSGFEELAETWSEPKLVRMRIDGGTKIVAFVGAGYDNIHEDTRYGNNSYFTDADAVALADVGNGNVASGGSTEATALRNPRGRGVYAIEIASLGTGGVPVFTNSGARIWGYVYGAGSERYQAPPASSTSPLLKYSFPAEIAAVDRDNNGYADTLYAVDTGGGVWKFRVGDSAVANWRGIRLFNLNSGTAAGKKFFYKPSVVVEPGYTMLFIGSGDREHPLNRDQNLVDGFYALKDTGQSTSDDLDEADLADLTSDSIQTTTEASGADSVAGITAALNASHGWYLSLNQRAGEKVLASPTVFNKVAYFTTFTPNAAPSTDPCRPGNLGISRVYALGYKNATAVMNFDTSNDSILTTNPLARTVPGQILQRSDRSTELGPGIASGMVVLVNPGGGTRGVIGVGGIVAGLDPKKGGSVLTLYWRQK